MFYQRQNYGFKIYVFKTHILKSLFVKYVLFETGNPNPPVLDKNKVKTSFFMRIYIANFE